MKPQRPSIAPNSDHPTGTPESSAGRPQPPSRYSCLDYRQEMTLLALQRRLNDPHLPESERAALREEIQCIQAEMGME